MDRTKRTNWEDVALDLTHLLGELHPDDKDVLDKILAIIDKHTTTTKDENK